MTRRPENHRRTAAILLWAAATTAIGADAELILQNGQVLRGIDVQREAGNYLLETDNGRVMSIPVELVAEVRLIEIGEAEPVPGLTPAEPRALAGADELPSGLRRSEPEVLAGIPVEPPRTSDQLAALGDPAKFQNDILQNRWQPESDWSNDPSQNDFAPVEWAKGPVDSTWKPESAFSDRGSLPEDGAGWQRSIVDPGWTPSDAFGSP